MIAFAVIVAAMFALFGIGAVLDRRRPLYRYDNPTDHPRTDLPKMIRQRHRW